jgi:hypothetical protein
VADDNEGTYEEFDGAVNMTAKELERWLDSDESKSVGQKSDAGGESTGHQSGRHIIKILKSRKSDLSDNDYAHMRKVIGYIKRHLAQRPSNNVKDSAWRYSLMNWGHDPVKK